MINQMSVFKKSYVLDYTSLGVIDLVHADELVQAGLEEVGKRRQQRDVRIRVGALT